MTFDRKRKLHIATTIAVMVFIFIQSALPGYISGAESNVIVRLIQRITGMDREALTVLVRKTAHFTEYMVLGLCLLINTEDHKRYAENKRTLEQTACKDSDNAFISGSSGAHRYHKAFNAQSGSRPAMCASAWALGTLYAVTDEIHQAFVPDRVCAFTDVCIDSLGVLTGVLLLSILRMNKRVGEKGSDPVKDD